MITFSKTCTHYMWVIAETVLQDGVEDALALWRQRMNLKRDCAVGCPFGIDGDAHPCAPCLEGRFRTMNLYRQTPLSVDCVFLRAVDTLKTWSNETQKTNPAAA